MAATTEHPFSLTPAQADNKVINYTSSNGKKLFNSATSKVNIEFDGNSANLKIFLESLCYCTPTSNWLQIMSIPDHTGTCQLSSMNMDKLLYWMSVWMFPSTREETVATYKTATSFTHAFVIHHQKGISKSWCLCRAVFARSKQRT